ncbi:uncharacterized protein Eint_110430 [Encephalitozoon intestinalis ATCC 50506]|uniref:Uncharacterized protein n=1 Tax=Encephalitozoon intestinalis (strain ATCC 50506) TaxID=876142 RepID=E0SAB8_ENCIT|nr:uncharacterized protein Eint_110430 [Encephalitozoon intestinalis ATCC 50506]ADM12543.1 hypothetical protein Eint_110430 [Encephalitozoon intestinalis ATCC 50506]UTX46399.1 hypothetical protein GPK93_11g20060 [Encephalitozoon intestinalis]
MFLLFLVFVFADNIEISRSSFDTLKVGNTYISSASHGASTWNSLKISFPGYYRYDVVEYEPRRFELVDVTQYFGETEKMVFRVDFETKYYGLIPDAWVMIISLTTLSGIMFSLPIKNV